MSDYSDNMGVESSFTINQVMQLRTKKISLIFVSILCTGILFLCPILYFLVKNTQGAFAAAVAFVVSILCLFLVLKNRTKLGSGILLITSMIILLLVIFSKLHDQEGFAAMLLTILGLTYVLIAPSGILVNKYFSIILTALFYSGFCVLIVLRGEALLIKKLPLLFVVYSLFTSVLFYIIRLQEFLLKKLIEEKEVSDSALIKAKDVMEKVGVFKREHDVSQTNIGEQLGEIDGNIREYTPIVNHLINSSNEISGEITVTQENLNKLSDSVDSITQKIDNQSGYIKNNAGIQDDIYNSINDMIGRIKEATTINHNLFEASKKGEKMSDEAEQSIKELENHQIKMQKIVKVISVIFSQINMLAMNAYIEAAHAGEAGAGFTVVAEEVRRLADESNIKAKQISKIIKEMNTEINNSVTMVHSIFDILQEVVGKADSLNMFITGLSESIGQLMENNNAMKSGNKELLSITQYVTDSSREELDIITDFTGTFSKLKSYFDNLLHAVNNLKEYNEKSLVSLENISEIKGENIKLNQAINELLENA